jgi:hypothetical protein
MAVTLEEPATTIFPGFSAEQLLDGDPTSDWFLEGYLAPGRVTLLSGACGVGKTTLLSVLIKRMETGGSLAGLAVRPPKKVVVEQLLQCTRTDQATSPRIRDLWGKDAIAANDSLRAIFLDLYTNDRVA